MEVATFLVSVFLSGLVGVVISIWYSHWSAKQQAKLRLLQQLLGNRNDIKGQLFTEALNQVFIVFDDSKPVTRAIQDFHRVVICSNKTNDESNKALLNLIKAICRDVNLRVHKVDDEFFLRPFNTIEPPSNLARSKTEVQALINHLERVTEEFKKDLSQAIPNSDEEKQALIKLKSYSSSKEVLKWVTGEKQQLLMPREDLELH
jgi:deoxyribodipyrimidine photolyase